MGRLANWFINRLPMPDTESIAAWVLQEIEDKNMIMIAAKGAIEENLYEIASEITYEVAEELRDDVTESVTYELDMCEIADNIDLDNLADHMDLDTAIDRKVDDHLTEVDFADYVDTDDIKSSVSDNIIDDVISELASRLED